MKDLTLSTRDTISNLSQVKNLQILFEICWIYRQDSRCQQILLIEVSKLVVKRKISKYRTVSPVIPKQNKFMAHNLKYNRRAYRSKSSLARHGSKSLETRSKSVPFDGIILPSQPKFSVPTSSSLCPFHNGSFPSKEPSTHPSISLPRILDSLSTRILSKQRIARKKGWERGGGGGRRGNAEVAMRQASERGSCGRLSRPNPCTNI